MIGENNNISITFLGHSSFLIKGNYSVVTDPFDKLGFPFKCEKVNFCLSSHNHYDHNAISLVEAEKYLTSENDFQAKEISLERIMSYHDECLGLKRGKNTIFKFVVSNVSFCHLGDFGETLDEKIVDRIETVDVLFLPIGGNYTINCDSAIQLIKLFKPKIAIPMHYKTPRSNINLDTIEKFIEGIKKEFEFEKKAKTFVITDLPTETRIILPDGSDY